MDWDQNRVTFTQISFSLRSVLQSVMFLVQNGILVIVGELLREKGAPSLDFMSKSDQLVTRLEVRLLETSVK